MEPQLLGSCRSPGKVSPMSKTVSPIDYDRSCLAMKCKRCHRGAVRLGTVASDGTRISGLIDTSSQPFNQSKSLCSPMAEAFINNNQSIWLRWLQRHFKCLHSLLRLCSLCRTFGSAGRRGTRIKPSYMTEVATSSRLRSTHRNAVTPLITYERAACCQYIPPASRHGTLSGRISTLDLDSEADCCTCCHLP